MSIATTREFDPDANGVKRLTAAPGDENNGVTTAPLPPNITKGPADYNSTPSYDKLAAATPAVSTVGNDSVQVMGEVKRAGTVVTASYTPNVLITGAATNNRRFRVVNKGQDGTGTTIVAELGFGNGTNAPVADEKALPLSGTAANLTVAAGDVLALESTHIGTGIADPGGLAQVEIAPA